jgi:CotS family spore coat protein
VLQIYEYPLKIIRIGAHKKLATYNKYEISILEGITLELSQVKSIVENYYNIEITDIEKVKNVYKIKSSEKTYCLKVIKYEYPHFFFILSVIKHIQNRGFEKIPQILPQLNGKDYINLGEKYAYLTPWIDARECNYDNPLDIGIAALKLAELHRKSWGFELTEQMKPRIGWFKWFDHFNTRRDEILDFRKRILSKSILTEFDDIYLRNIEIELERCSQAITNLSASNYLSKMKLEVEKHGVCHHDFAHHNVLVEKDGSVNLIDFDYTILDTHLHDLSSLLIRRMKNGKWDIENALFILNSYNSIYKVENDDIEIMCAFMEFPQDFWQVGIQYYWEVQPWGEEFFLKKLERILEDNIEKQDFIEEFRGLKYKS